MSHIKTFARLKPAQELYEDYEINNKKTFSLRVPELLRDYGLLASKNRLSTISYDFQFDRVFDAETSQEEVYNLTAKEIVTGFLDGYNGTIFAYGQTGTGKTYTVEGSPLRYSDRGLAPRALTEIYKSLEQRDSEDISLHISYLEIYQEVAYDLLSTSARTASPVTVFPRVNVVEGANGTCTIRNLSVHLAPSEDVAHALLLQGQANRKVAETPVNQRSSRSHAVFTIYLMAKKQQSDIITRSKLHLVDLAGSERVAKTGVDGQQLTEAKCINLSLHYLESVIIALQAESGQNRPHSTSSGNRINTSSIGRPSTSDGVRRHIPYRNSMLTMVLRDSLGGNCLTSMIATISLEVHNLGETLSTCRFAQRVACIANCARRNEEIDDKTLIQQLKRRIAELEVQMACLRMSQNGEGDRHEEEDTSSKLTDEDKLSCAQVVQEYLAGRIVDPITAGITNPFKFRECLRILKKMVMTKYFQTKLGQNGQMLTNGSTGSGPINQTPAHGTVTGGTVENNSGVVEVRGNAQILRLDNGPQASESEVNNSTAQPTTNGEVDTDELILNIQRLYAASRRDKRLQQQSPQIENPSTPPRSAMRPNTYKSPFERKREKEIRRLSRRVDTMKKSQSTQEQQLNALRTNTAFGEMCNMEFIVRNKIQVTRDQIADQHAYRLHLRHTEANPEILQQEKMVEDQLIKREAKFQKKLDEVLEKKKELETKLTQDEGAEDRDGGEGQGQMKTGEKRNLEDQFSQYKKRNGTLNTRQVFDMLKSEERKQTKATQQTNTEKTFLMTKQLAVKEEATRERLRELKEMLRKSREEAILGHSDEPVVDAFHSDARNSGFSVLNSNAFSLQMPFATDDKKQMQVTDLDGHSLDQTFVMEKSEEEKFRLAQPSREDLETSMTRGEDGEKNQTVHNVGQTGAGVHGGSIPRSQEQPSTSKTPSRSSSKVELKWESGYSRPSTAHSLCSQEGIEPQRRKHTSGSNADRNNCDSVEGVQGVQSQSVMNKRRDGHEGRISVTSSSTDLSSEVKSVSPNPRLDFFNESDGQEVMADMEERKSDDGRDYISKEDIAVARESYLPTVMPSEYVHRMDSKDKFDARKMGLSSKTFDSALSSMLNDDGKTVSYGFQYYDKYARASKPAAKKGAPSRSYDRRTTAASRPSPEQRRAAAAKEIAPDHTGKFANAWGPEAKGFSVAKRLAQFLSEDKDSSAPSRPATTTSTRTSKSVSFLERLTQLQDDEMAEDPEVTSPRIQALEDTQREPTYMGRIQAERERVAKIRQAREAAEAIQRAWRRHCRTSQ